MAEQIVQREKRKGGKKPPLINFKNINRKGRKGEDDAYGAGAATKQT